MAAAAGAAAVPLRCSQPAADAPSDCPTSCELAKRLPKASAGPQGPPARWPSTCRWRQTSWCCVSRSARLPMQRSACRWAWGVGRGGLKVGTLAGRPAALAIRRIAIWKKRGMIWTAIGVWPGLPHHHHRRRRRAIACPERRLPSQVCIVPSLQNPTDERIAFKVKTTAPNRYTVRLCWWPACTGCPRGRRLSAAAHSCTAPV